MEEKFRCRRNPEPLLLLSNKSGGMVSSSSLTNSSLSSLTNSNLSSSNSNSNSTMALETRRLIPLPPIK